MDALQQISLPFSLGLVWLVVLNGLGFVLMALDKSKARRGLWRIPEATLFAVALLGGSLGSWAGMYAFHHKTKHWYFVVVMPLILALQIAGIVWLQTIL